MVAPPGADAPDAHTLVVRITPGAAFGGADHPTTRACLELLEPRVQPGDRVLDVGTGSGVLAIAAALLGAAHVTAIEADPLACREARANVALNEVADRVDVVEARARPGFLPGEGPFDAVTANLEGAHLLPLLPTLASAVVPGGWLAVGGLVAPERDAAIDAAHAGGLELVEERRVPPAVAQPIRRPRAMTASSSPRSSNEPLGPSATSNSKNVSGQTSHSTPS
jgi:ribosomal protein L11 methyltransferase